MTKPTLWQFSRKRDGQPLEKLWIRFPENWGELKASEALEFFQFEVERLGLDEE